ncbi:MAG: ABC transporter substrate-binding protein [Flavobacteriales bacterium]
MERIFTDQMNRTVRLEGIPRRIVSLVPSQTELLHDLGLEDEVVGITKFCIYPDEWFGSKTRVGGTKQVNIEKVSKLQPDLIIGNKEENTKEDIEALEEIAPVWMSDIYNIEDALEMICSIGEIVDCKEKAVELAKTIQTRFDQLANPMAGRTGVYLIWKDPYLSVGTNTFIHSVIARIGFQNSIREVRYPEWKSELTELPEFLFLSTEPFPFKEDDVESLKDQFPGVKVMLVDGEMFSWYGSRMRLAPRYFRDLFNEITLPE